MNYFLQGILYIAPIGITVYIIYIVFTFVDNLLRDILGELLGIYTRTWSGGHCFSAFVGKERKFSRPVLVLVNPAEVMKFIVSAGVAGWAQNGTESAKNK